MSKANRNSLVSMVVVHWARLMVLGSVITRSLRATSDSMKCVVRLQLFRRLAVASKAAPERVWLISRSVVTNVRSDPIAEAITTSVREKPRFGLPLVMDVLVLFKAGTLWPPCDVDEHCFC